MGNATDLDCFNGQREALLIPSPGLPGFQWIVIRQLHDHCHRGVSDHGGGKCMRYVLGLTLTSM